ncbi:MAG: type 1 glutamine amidotransferase [Methylotenera sp.]|jgi:GMP synthase (glutamine-hydrolysing)|nr:type 1 glutamine amidotransferase [Methylotenera sp.]
MRSIAILQHDPLQGPGFLQDCLRAQGWDTRVIRPAFGDPVPRRSRDFAGLVVLGSDHSVHDRLGWIVAERALLRDALACDVPVLGHCFGAQQLALAAGGRVHRNAWPNIGWSQVWVTPAGRPLLGGARTVEVFNWHYDTFELPPGAQRTLYGTHCLNKGFTLGPHLGFQCHLEVTEAGLRRWCDAGREEVQALRGPAVQTWADIQLDLGARTAALQAVARETYRHWTNSLTRPPLLRVGLGLSV